MVCWPSGLWHLILYVTVTWITSLRVCWKSDSLAERQILHILAKNYIFFNIWGRLYHATNYVISDDLFKLGNSSKLDSNWIVSIET